MKNPLLLLLLCCLVLSLAAPASADYWFYRDVSATDFTNALVDYCNHDEVRNLTWGDRDIVLSGHDCRTSNVTRTNDTLEFRFLGRGGYCMFIPIPLPWIYMFDGVMHVDNPQEGLKRPYTITITDDDTEFTAIGENWRLKAWNTDSTRFKV